MKILEAIQKAVEEGFVVSFSWCEGDLRVRVIDNMRQNYKSDASTRFNKFAVEDLNEKEEWVALHIKRMTDQLVKAR